MGLFGAFFNAPSEDTINSGAQAPETRTRITGTLKTLAHALVVAVMVSYVWLALGSFLYNRVASTNTNGQPETFGGITNAKDGLALATVHVSDKWNRGSNSLVNVMVDSGASGHYFDDALILRIRYRPDNCRGASTGGSRPRTASRSHNRCSTGAAPYPNLDVGCAWLRAYPLLG